MASPQGGEAPFDPASASASAKPESDTTDITALARHWEAWTHTYKIRELVARAGAGEFDAVFYVGGRGGMSMSNDLQSEVDIMMLMVAMFDLVRDAASLALIQNVAAAGKPIAAVSHGPAALLNATAPSGVSLLAGAGVTGFSRKRRMRREWRRLCHFSWRRSWSAYLGVDMSKRTDLGPRLLYLRRPGCARR